MTVMVGVTYRSSSARPGARGATAPPPLAPQAVQRAPPPTFRDKQSYTELFKPLPKPEPIPSMGGAIKVKVCPSVLMSCGPRVFWS